MSKENTSGKYGAAGTLERMFPAPRCECHDCTQARYHERLTEALKNPLLSVPPR